MLTTVQLLDLLEAKLGSDYKTHKALNIDQSRISKLRNGKGIFTNAQGVEIAKILGLKEEFVILSLTAEREENSNVRSILGTLADKFQPKAAAAAVIFSIFLAAPFALPAFSHIA